MSDRTAWDLVTDGPSVVATVTRVPSLVPRDPRWNEWHATLTDTDTNTTAFGTGKTQAAAQELAARSLLLEVGQ